VAGSEVKHSKRCIVCGRFCPSIKTHCSKCEESKVVKIKEVHKYDTKCSVCGHFCKSVADYSIPFSTGGFEEGKLKYYCDKCAKTQEEYYVSQGWVPNSWVKAKWERRVAQRLGFVEICCDNSVWTYWLKGDVKIPKGCEKYENTIQWARSRRQESRFLHKKRRFQ